MKSYMEYSFKQLYKIIKRLLKEKKSLYKTLRRTKTGIYNKKVQINYYRDICRKLKDEEIINIGVLFV